MDRLVRVNPDQLDIHFRPSARSSTEFTVTNLMHTMSIAVHLTPTGPDRLYAVSPVSPSLIPPLSSATFTLTLTSPTDRPPVRSPPDSVRVRAAMVPTSKPDPAHLRRIFSVPGKHVFKDSHVPIYLVGSHVLDHLLLSSSGETLESNFIISRAISTCSTADLSALLRRSSAAGNASFVAELISAGADVDSRGPDSRSAVSLAVSSGSVSCIEHLIAAGASIDLSIDRVFHESAAANRTAVISLLERSTAGSSAWGNAVDSGGRTPVHYAAANGHVDALRPCLGSGRGDPDRADANGWTPLHCAAFGGFINAVELLLDSSRYNSTAILTTDGKKSALDLATENGHEHLYDMLGLTADLFRACTTGDMDLLKRCVSIRVDLDRRDQNGWSALHRAAAKGQTEIVEYLVDNGAKLDVVDDVGFTPLRCAAEAGMMETVMVLVDRGSREGLKGVRGVDLFKMKLDSCCVDDKSSVPLFCFDSKGIET